jgi:hypothetical protein
MQGTKIHATVLKCFSTSCLHLLQENQCLYIRSPTLAAVKNKVKYVVHSHKISFNEGTSVRRCNDFTGLEYGFGFTDFGTLLNKTVDVNIAIGNLCQVFNIKICIVYFTPISFILCLFKETNMSEKFEMNKH